MTKRKSLIEKKIFLESRDIEEILEETIAQFDFDHVSWLSDEEYQKAITQLRMQVYGVFDFLKVDNKLPVKYLYGMGEFIEGAVDEIVRLAEDFGLRVRKIDKALSLEIIRRKHGYRNWD
jgi:6-pyruvoyl-tetrahydropterin synthase